MASLCPKLAVLAVIVALASAHCPPYWTAYKDSCYQIFNQPMPWEQAQVHCMGFSTCEGNEVGSLASIGSVAANSFIVSYKKMIEVLGGPTARVWIGLNDLAFEGQFEWVNGVNVTYTNWELNQPNNDQGQENCVAFPGPNSLDQWDDANCIEALPFVCELPGKDPNAAPAMFMCPPLY